MPFLRGTRYPLANTFEFTPARLPGLMIWCKHQTGITVTGAGVSQWDDISGKGNHLLQATDANRPLPSGLGSEKVTNGAFAADTDWTKDAGWTIATGVATCDGTSGNITSIPDLNVIAGVLTSITYDITAYTSGSVKLNAAGAFASTAGGASRSTTGTFEDVLTPSADGTIQLASNLFVGSIDNVSVKQVTGASDGILFTGIDSFIKADAFTFAQPGSIYLLCKQITWTLNDRIFDGDAASTGTLIQEALTPKIKVFAGNSTLENSDFVLDTYAVVLVLLNGVSSLIQINNNTPTTGDSGNRTMEGFTLGARGDSTLHSHIQVKEVIVTNTAHDAHLRRKVIKYLAKVGKLSI